MELLFPLALTALLPAVSAILLYSLTKRTPFGKLKNRSRQLVYGLVFALAAILGTIFGVHMDGVSINARVATILGAGLIFGGPSGILAGFLAGIAQTAAGMQGLGLQSWAASVMACLLSGFIGALLRRYMFDDKIPSPLYALLIGLVCEVAHIMLVIGVDITAIQQTMGTTTQYALPLILVNGLSLLLAVMAVRKLSGKPVFQKANPKNITSVFQRWLSVCVLVAFFVTVGFTLLLQQRIFVNDTDELLQLNISDVMADISDASDTNLLELTRQVAAQVNAGGDIGQIAAERNIAEINIINEAGIITETTNPDFLQFDMASGEQSAEFLVLLNGTQEYVQEYQPVSHASKIYRKYAGVVLEGGGFVQVGYDAEHFQQDIDKEVVFAAKNRHVGQTGGMIIANEKWIIVSDSANKEGRNLLATGLWISTALTEENVRYEATIYDIPCYYMYCVSEGYYIISVLPQAEAVFTRNLSIALTVFIEIIVFAALFILVYILIKKLVVNNIRKINSSLSEITGGNLDVVVDVRSNEEFASLSDDINSTVVTLKRYIDDAAARIDEELTFAKNIQHSALPSVAPLYTDRPDFAIFATMDTAKEVGGDFYDFFFVGNDRLAFLIADVSGKGIPAAMFMMSAKSLIKGYVESGLDTAETLTLANDRLCEGNDAGMFVTVWLAILDLKTGELEFSNAGHNPPLLMRSGGTFSYLRSRPGLVLAGMEGIRYRKYTEKLHRGDRIYLYTDGVTEAIDLTETLYGEDRLLQALDRARTLSPRDLCAAVKADTDAFVGEAPQFDDITMLCLDFTGQQVQSLTVAPTQDAIGTVTAFMETTLAACGVPVGATMRLSIAVDEIFSNIMKFSGATCVEVTCYAEDATAYLQFADDGLPYNPLEQADPDTGLRAEDRAVGGLGIFLVRKTMSGMEYEHRGGKNILSLKLDY